MKQLTTLLLAVGLGAAGALAQNVTVMLKDGTSQKFNADYISEISFKEIPDAPDAVQLTNVSVFGIYGSEAILTFTNEEGVEVNVDFYGPEDAMWLNEGAYNVNDTMDPMTVCTDDRYTYVTVGGEKKAVTSGQATVAVDSEEVYTVSLDFTLADGSNFLAEYKGKVVEYSKTINVALASASYNSNAQPKGDFYVSFDSEDWKYHMTVVFTGESDATVLSAGTYTVTEDRRPGTFSFEKSSVEHYGPNWDSKFVGGSNVVVEKEGDNYKMTFRMELANGRILNATFEGAISGTPSFKDNVEVFEGTINEMYYYDKELPAGQFWIKGNNSDWTFDTRFDYVADPTAKTLPAGVYTYSESGEPGTFGSGSYVDIYDPYRTMKMREGSTITVTLNDGVYTFEMDLTFTDDSKAKITYSGEISGTPKFEQPTVEVLEFDKCNGTAWDTDGNITLEFNFSSDRYKSLQLDTYGNAPMALSEGVFTVGESSGSEKYISSTPSSTAWIEDGNRVGLKSGTMTVSKQGTEYTIEMDFTLDDNDSTPIKGTYNGPVPVKLFGL